MQRSIGYCGAVDCKQTVESCAELELHSLRNTQPVQLVVQTGQAAGTARPPALSFTLKQI